jgi:cupin fold WbuC family metalloprotein
MQARRINDEVYVADERIVRVTRHHIERLRELAADTPRRRVRLCAHKDSRDALHEMLIVLDSATYIQPHRHRNKSESFHVIDGLLSVVVFTDDGRIEDVIRLGDYASGRTFFYRLADAAYHTVLLESERAVFHETTNGPFRREETEFAPWAPAEADAAAARQFLDQLTQEVNGFRPAA